MSATSAPVALAFIGLAAAVSACGGRRPLGPGPAPEDALASVTLALTQAPDDVKCLSIIIHTDREDRRSFETAAGSSSLFPLRRLPIGLAVFSVEAFNAPCASVGTAAPTWTGGPLPVTLVRGDNGTITIVMQPASRATVAVDFPSTDAGSCAPAASACLADSHCCSGHCGGLGEPGAIGRCQPPVTTADAGPEAGPESGAADGPVPTSAAVMPRLEGGQAYFVYAPGAQGCGRTDGKIYTVSLRMGERACVPIERGQRVSVPLEDLQDCTAGGGCAPCTNSSCLPSNCFERLPPPEFGACSRVLDWRSGEEVTHYIIFEPVARAGAPEAHEGLPMVLAMRSNAMVPEGEGTVVIRPPSNLGRFIIGHFDPAAGDPDVRRDICDETSLCGVLPFWGIGTVPFVQWQISARDDSSGLRMWSFF